ncbi:hypothetical protein HY991_00050 [Candidatus Micrarchaeota archaeon]|nr:hypothetical protein [Candidatus Micrarchaeota archaeon]
MVCYIVPSAAALVCLGARKRLHSGDQRLLWLNLMLAGGAVFGIVDHWWNGELLAIGKNIGADLLLGVAITLAIVVLWAVVVTAQAIAPEKKRQLIECTSIPSAGR